MHRWWSLCLILCACRRETTVLPAEAPTPSSYERGLQEAYQSLPPGAAQQFDPLSILAMIPGRDWKVDWPEHPKGFYRKNTNNLGFNRKASTHPAKTGLRILVVGDSHTEGVVSTPELFTTLLERRLQREGYGRAEVLNAGTGYLGTHGYLGLLHKYAALAPDFLVAMLYVGNDFMNDLRVESLLGRAPLVEAPEEYYHPFAEAMARWHGPLWQGINQLYRFKAYPEEATVALDTTERNLAEMATLCSERGMRFWVVLLPTKRAVEPETDETIPLAAAHFGLTGEELELEQQLAAELRRRLEARGIACLDPLEDFRAVVGRELYWKTDHHLNVNGHALLAELLHARLGGTLGPPESYGR